MGIFSHTTTHEDNDTTLANRASGLDLNDRPASRATQRTSRTIGAPKSPSGGAGAGAGVWDGAHGTTTNGPDNTANGNGGQRGSNVGLGSVLNADPDEFRDGEAYDESSGRPPMNQRPSRSYVHKPIPVVTTYEPELSNKQRSIEEPLDGNGTPTKSRVKRESKNPSGNDYIVDGVSDGFEQQPTSRAPSRAASTRQKRFNETVGAAGIGAGGLAVGQLATQERQNELQGANRHSLYDNGVISRGSTYEEPQQYQNDQRTISPRPQSSFGHRPQPQLMSINEGMGNMHGGRDSRAIGRSGTLSRANTLGRNGTLSRGANGGTIGSRRGAFGRGAGASVGTQPEEVLGREDIHSRAEISERHLDEATLRRLSNMEKKDARRLTKVIKKEAKAEAKAVAGAIKALERLGKLQKEAAREERKSELRLSKWTTNEHKARLRFLKEKERYEKIEGELRNAENDYEERRDHAAGLTAQVAEKAQDLDDLRAQKAADDREREVKIVALKTPAHS